MDEEFKAILNGSYHVKIGKNGITPGILKHINNKFKQNKIMKIKVMPDAVIEQGGMDHIIGMLMKELSLYVYDERGHTFIVSKKRIHGLRIPKKFRMLSEKEKEDKSLEPEPEFINYDDEELLEKIDKQSDKIYRKK